MKTLIIAAHPDDEAYGCGGLIAKYASSTEIHVLTITDGGNPEEAAEYIKESKKILKYKESHFLSWFLDQKLDTIPVTEIAEAIYKVIDKNWIELVITHSMNDLNKDHRLVTEATMIATRTKPDWCGIKEVWSYEIPSSTNWAFGQFGSFEPNLFLQLDDLWLDKKRRAIEVYKKEAELAPHARSWEAVSQLAGWRGKSVGCSVAEAYRIIRKII